MWPHEMANDNAPYIKLYKRVLKKRKERNYTSDLRERDPA